MTDFVTRHAATRSAPGVQGPPRRNQAEEILVTPWLVQQALQGRAFIAGHGIEEAGIDGEAALDDTTPSYALVAPTNGDIVVMPLFFRAYFDTEGGAAPDMHLTYVQADKAVYNSGTAVTALNLLGGTSGNGSTKSPQAQVRSSLSSVTAITDAQNVVLSERIHILDNFVSVEGATTSAGVEGPGRSTMEFVWKPDFPVLLRSGSAILFYTATGTTDSKYNYSVAWVELDADPYVV